MSEKMDYLKNRLTKSRAHLDFILDQVGDRWDIQIYADGAAWTTKQLLIHLADADRGQSNLVMNIAKGENPIPEDFDINRYNQRSVEKRADMTVEQARAALNDNRASFLLWLDSIDNDTLETTLAMSGRHASLQILTIEQIIKVMSNHERGHADDIAKVLNIAPAIAQ
jgi:hypothetical protein